MSLLIYIGNGAHYPGWPSSDHDEPDEEVYAAKLASRLYRSETGKEIKEREADRSIQRALRHNQR